MKIAAVAAYQELADLFREVFEKQGETEPKPEYGDGKFELEVSVAVNADAAQRLLGKDADVIIARGATAMDLRVNNLEVPVVELPIAGYDLTLTLFQIKKHFKYKKVAAIGSINMIMGIGSLAQVMGIEIKSYNINKHEEIPNLVEQAISDGAEAVIGGVTTCDYAEKMGVRSILLKTGAEAVWYAISEAKRVANLSRREQEKALRFKTILDYAYEGVIALDNKNMITVFNASSGKILGINAPKTVGRKFHEIVPKSKFVELVDKEGECKDEIVRHYNEQLAVNKVPMILKGERVGTVIAFQDVTGIQEMEGKIRQKIYTRGLVARYNFEDIIGKGKAIKDVIKIAKEFSRVDSSILIVGETGTGKELFAQSIHNFSLRKEGPFVAVNCAALPEDLLESELFGYVEGAFTGAVKGGKIGLFEMAHKGTIFLDEISEISPKLQSRLLRVIQEKEIMRLGHDRVTPVDVRIISATNRNLYKMAKQREFRQDLYYRLDVLKICLPSLYERKEDIELIAENFIRQCCAQFQKKEITVTESALRQLKSYSWPGNIRELRNICERVVVLNRNGVISEKEIIRVLSDVNNYQDAAIGQFANNASSPGCVYQEEIKQLERARIKEVLISVGNNKTKAANILGISRTTLWRLAKKLEE